jgi:hypothetical protein
MLSSLREASARLPAVLAVALVVRLAFIAWMPAAAHSADADAWETVARLLDARVNPYAATSFLNWPPVWLLCIAAMSGLSHALGVPFFRVLQTTLILVELGTLALAWALLRRVRPEAAAARWVLFGLALNPVAVLLTCQHCNFDGLVALAVLGFALALGRFHRTGAATDWLEACLFLGLGVVTKTAPLVLVPLLVPGGRALGARGWAFGLTLVLGPAALGLGVLYALTPEAIVRNVLAYRSLSGFYGITGLLHRAGLLGAEQMVARLAGPIFAVVLASLSIALWKRPALSPRAIVLGAALLLFAVPILGPGYAPQYLGWVLPLLVVLAALPQRRLRLALAVFAVVAVPTYLLEYGLLPSHGMAALHLWPGPVLEHASAVLGERSAQTLLRLPLFLASLLLLATMASTWKRWLRPVLPTEARALAPHASGG